MDNPSKYLGKWAVKGAIPWNKGKKTGLVPKTAFNKGQESWNKGKKIQKLY